MTAVTPARWARIRAALLALHVVAVVVLSLPGAQIARPERWTSRLMLKDLADWSAELGALGFEISPERLGETVRGLAEGYVAVRSEAVAPFERYARATGARQGWAMFASPQRRPYEFHIDARFDADWTPLYRPHDDQANFLADYLRHNRMRKFQGRFARALRDHYYEDFAAFVARRAFEDTAATQVRVALYGYATLPPERTRAGERPHGSYDRERIFSRDASRDAR